MDDKLQEIREALSKATPGPWYTDNYDVEYDPFSNDESKKGKSLNPIAKLCAGYTPNPNHENDAYFIANAPEYITYLLQVVEERGKALEFYENKENYDIREVEVSEHVTEYVSNVSEDYGDCARKALGKE